MGKTVLITGASSGMGFVTGRMLTEEGHTVYGTTRKEELDGFGFKMLQADVRDETATAGVVDIIIKEQGRIDVLINNAGIGLRGALEETSASQAMEIIQTNLMGVHITTRAVLPHMRSQKAGMIITIGSIAGLVAIPYNGIYSASKFALEGYTQTLRLEVARFGIRVSMINPGFVVTKFADSASYAEPMDEYSQLRQKAFERIENGLGSGPDPDIVAEAVAELIEERVSEHNYIVGEDANALLDDWNSMQPDEFEEKILRSYGLLNN